MRTLFMILLAFLIQAGMSQTGTSSLMKEIPFGSHAYLQVDDIGNDILVHILAVEKYDKDLDPSKTAVLFEKIPEPGTIELYFGKGKDGGPFKSILLIRNNAKKTIEFQGQASDPGQGATGARAMELRPGVISSELWNEELKGIILSGFKVKE